jgi:hypothetical protein
MSLVQALTENVQQTLLTLQTQFTKPVQTQYLELKTSTMLGSSVVQTSRQPKNVSKSKQITTGDL